MLSVGGSPDQEGVLVVDQWLRPGSYTAKVATPVALAYVVFCITPIFAQTHKDQDACHVLLCSAIVYAVLLLLLLSTATWQQHTAQLKSIQM